MARSLKKGPFVDTSFFRLANWNSEIEDSKVLRVWSRRSLILPTIVGRTVEVHNGKSFLNFRITEDMVGHKYGEFASTRKKGVHKKKGKKK
jgi:small subunit ribosomal protein S19